MKKFISLLLVFLLCFSFCGCQKNTTYEIAEKLDGIWAAAWDSALGEMGNIYEFKYSAKDTGSCEFQNIWDGDIIVHYISGVYCVTDDEIIIDFYGEIDDNGNTVTLESKRQLTLNYTYENGNLVVTDAEHEFFLIEYDDTPITIAPILTSSPNE